MRDFSVTRTPRSKIKILYLNSFREIKDSVHCCTFTTLEYAVHVHVFEKEKGKISTCTGLDCSLNISHHSSILCLNLKTSFQTHWRHFELKWICFKILLASHIYHRDFSNITGFLMDRKLATLLPKQRNKLWVDVSELCTNSIMCHT